MEIRNLQYFIAVVEANGFSEAARRLNVSQPAITQCVQKMEAELNTPLLVRGKTITTTPAGEMVYTQGKEIVEAERKLRGEVEELIHPGDAVFHIGMSPFYSKHYMPSIFVDLMKKMPEVKVNLVEDISVELEKRLLNGALDFGFVPEEPKDEGLDYRPFCIEEILLGVPKESPINQYATPSPTLPYLDLRYVQNMPFISLRNIQKISPLLDKLCEKVNISRNIIYQTLDWDTVNAMIASGAGVGFVPDMFCAEGDTKGVAYYRIPNKRVLRHYALAYPHGTTISTLAERVIKLFIMRITDYRNKIQF